uniref:Putative anchor protein n=1 Tax=viral metagenome TaxID=1070528 RepID=A0A6H1ZWI9_9ZZZZ
MAIVITNPISTSEWKKGTEYTITWTGDVTIVNILLYKNSAFVENIAIGFTQGVGSYPWTPGVGLVSGIDYQIYVEDDNTFDYSDNFKIYSAFVVQLNDSLGLGDSISEQTDYLKLLSDNLTLSDSIVAKVDYLKLLTDNLTLSDDIIAKVDYLKLLSDNLTLSDDIIAKVDYLKLLTDNLTLSDSLVAKIGYKTILSDNLTLSDSINVTVTRGGNAVFFGHNF